jgi:hypothetical protein
MIYTINVVDEALLHKSRSKVWASLSSAGGDAVVTRTYKVCLFGTAVGFG